MPFTPTIPKARYGLIMAGTTLIAAGVSASVAAVLGGDGTVILSVLTAFLIGSVFTFIPAIARVGHDHWGVVVLFSGVSRSLLVLAIAYSALHNNPDMVARPLFLGAVSGTFLVLMAETAAAVSILSKIERERVAAKAAATTA
ncbi:MAG: hypothetical protein ACT4PL_10685 [Phycisphaerales bacterium]